MASQRITADRAFGLIFVSDDFDGPSSNDDFSFYLEENDLSDFSCLPHLDTYA